MQGTDRRLVVQPTTLAAHDVQQAAKVQDEADAPFIPRLGRFSVWLNGRPEFGDTVQVEVDPSANPGLALVWLWKTDKDGGRTGLDYCHVSSADLRTFAAQLVDISIAIDAQAQAALEQDCDRREEIQRLGHES